MYLLSVAVVTSCVILVFGQSPQCLTSDGRRKECIPLEQCESLANLARKTDRSASELTFLRRSFCGYRRAAEATVCCPETHCITPDGTQGKCISLNACPHLSARLQPPFTKEKSDFVQRYSCTGPERFSVCCAPPSLERFGEDDNYGKSCQAQMTAFPPARKSGCCGDSTSTGNKIYGGNETAIDDYPWAVVIEYNIILSYLPELKCGGVLISDRYVLTAAHCITGALLRTAIPKIVRLGEYDTDHDGPDCVITSGGGKDCTLGEKRVRIEKSIPHPNYDRQSKRNDIGLIRMRERAPYTDFIRPVCLPSKDLTQRENMPPSFSLYAVGWGLTKYPWTVKRSNIKLHVSLPFVDFENVHIQLGKFDRFGKCQSIHKSMNSSLQLWKGQFCAGGVEGEDTCGGDSGGPLVYEDGSTFELVGIVSYGLNECGQKNVPGVYTNVYEYLDWINSNIVA